jgi:predicted DNA-binding ribbon-helix-helix protein
MGANIKRSLVIEGRKTSVALEKEYWEGLTEIANSQGRSLAMMIEEIGKLAISGSLASSVRVFVLRHFRRPQVTAPILPRSSPGQLRRPNVRRTIPED